MESQMAHTHGHGKTHEQEPHVVGHHTSSVAEGHQDEHYHEKKSVLKKVKAKAKKIKDTLTKHGHGHHDHDRDHDHIPDDHDLDEEDDDGEEMVEGPEVHGAPMYESTAVKTIGLLDSGVNTGRSTPMEVDPRISSVNPDKGIDLENVDCGKEAGTGNQRVDLGLTTVVGEIPGAPQNTPVLHTAPGIHHTRDNDPTRTFVHSEEERSGQSKVNLQRPKGLEEDPAAPKDRPGAYVPGNYQTKVDDYTRKGGEEAGVTPVLHSFDKMKIYDESKPNSGLKQSLPTGTENFLTSVPTGSHDQFSPELTPPERRSTENYPQENIVDRSSKERDQFSPQLTPPQRMSSEDYPQVNIVDRPFNERDEFSPETGTEDFHTSVPTESHDQFSPELTPPECRSTENYPQENIVDRSSKERDQFSSELTPPQRMSSEDHPQVNIVDRPFNERDQFSPETGTKDFLTSVPTGSHDQFSPEVTPPERRSTENYPQENIIGRSSKQRDQFSQELTPPQRMSSEDYSQVNIVDKPLNERDQFSPELTPPQRMSTEDNRQENIVDRLSKERDQFSPELTPPQHMSSEDYPQVNIVDGPFNKRDQFSPELNPPQHMSTEDNRQENMVDRPSNQDSYTEKISSATSAITGKAISAKNVIASKLGYGEKDNTGHEARVGDKNSMPASAVDYGKKMANTVTEKLTPVYEKVAGSGNTVMSKMQGTTTGTGTANTHERGVEGQDKGVSMKDYFAEKLRPGEEDRALSEVISEALHKKKVDQEKPAATSRPVSEVISDALHKRKEEPSDETDRPMGNVTESEEVARRLGTHENDSSKETNMNSSFISNNSSTSGKGMVDKIKGAVGSWFGKGEESQGSQQSLGSSFGSANEGARQETGITVERRLQESAN